ncbi:MAG: hypothetical protein SGJ27_03495 [Candidatus Melainabacteria bacterium]|nr:hypothetical protein [Candidatus Melainabacteria bacterium]
MVDENCNRIDQAAAVLTSRLHTGDGGNEARNLLAFDANTMGKADYTAMIEKVQTNEATMLNNLMRTGRHDEAIQLLREDANIFGNGEQFMELASEVREKNRESNSPTQIVFDNVYQQGDQHGRPTALEVEVRTTFLSAQTGQQYEKAGVVAVVDNRTPQDAVLQAPPHQEVIIITPPAAPPVHIDTRIGIGIGGGGRSHDGRPNVGIGIGVDNHGNFSFNLEIEIGRERVRRADPRWCPDRNWRPHNAPRDFDYDREVNRTREDYRRRGDNDWNPRRETPRTVINQINNTTIINNNTRIENNNSNNTNSNNRSRTENTDNSRTRTQETTPQRGDAQPRRPENDRRPPTAERPTAAPERAAQQQRPPQQERSQPRRENPRENSNGKDNADERRAQAEKARQNAMEQREKARKR